MQYKIGPGPFLGVWADRLIFSPNFLFFSGKVPKFLLIWEKWSKFTISPHFSYISKRFTYALTNLYDDYKMVCWKIQALGILKLKLLIDPKDLENWISGGCEIKKLFLPPNSLLKGKPHFKKIGKLGS